ncbi:MAG: LptE family protein [candidate division NC10 bacterium]|nr:LptE family protein [candidate division NC10 bacterium]MDE2322162.1 LptE family protein [candidate division NC10 bacterium]
MRTIICVTVLLALAGCGYRPVGSGGVSALQPSVKTISIGLVNNRTFRPTIQPALRDALIHRLAADGRIRVVEEGADVLLEGAIEGFSEVPLAFGSADTATRLRLTISFSFTLKNRLEDKVFLRDGVTGVAYYFTGTGLAEARAAEDEASLRAVADLVEQVVGRVLDGV